MSVLCRLHQQQALLWMRAAVLIPILLLLGGSVCQFPVHAQVSSPAAWNDSRVLLQGFYWESYRHGKARFPQFGSKPWYEVVRAKVPAIAAETDQLKAYQAEFAKLSGRSTGGA